MKNKKGKYISLALFILQGFMSMPLAVHISKLNFSISISLDAIIWQIIGIICHKIWYEKEQEFSTVEIGDITEVGENKNEPINVYK